MSGVATLNINRTVMAAAGKHGLRMTQRLCP